MLAVTMLSTQLQLEGINNSVLTHSWQLPGRIIVMTVYMRCIVLHQGRSHCEMP
jgi:hypothetical protein